MRAHNVRQAARRWAVSVLLGVLLVGSTLSSGTRAAASPELVALLEDVAGATGSRYGVHDEQGVGLDAAVVRRCDAHPERKARYKQWYFAAAAVATFCQEYLVHPPRLETHADGRVIVSLRRSTTI